MRSSRFGRDTEQRKRRRTLFRRTFMKVGSDEQKVWLMGRDESGWGNDNIREKKNIKTTTG